MADGNAKKSLWLNDIILPTGRIFFSYLFKLDDKGKFSTGGYKCSVMWPVDKAKEQLADIRAKILALAKEAFPDVPVKRIQLPFQLGDKTAGKYPWKAGMITMNSKRKATNGRPVVFEGTGKARVQLEPGDLKNGDYCRLCVGFYTYETSERVRNPETGEVEVETVYGVAAKLEAVQKRADGEPLGGGSASVNLDAFDAEAEDEFDTATASSGGSSDDDDSAWN